jgi:hypothetical protein
MIELLGRMAPRASKIRMRAQRQRSVAINPSLATIYVHIVFPAVVMALRGAFRGRNHLDHESNKVIARLSHHLPPIELFLHRLIAPYRCYADRHENHCMRLDIL